MGLSVERLQEFACSFERLQACKFGWRNPGLLTIACASYSQHLLYMLRTWTFHKTLSEDSSRASIQNPVSILNVALPS